MRLLHELANLILTLYPYYSQNLRSPLFTGFLSLGAFLFTLSTFIVIKMKEGVYDTASYRNNVDELRTTNPKLTVYGPLKRLTALLSIIVALAFFTAVAQMTLGLFPRWYSAFICVLLATITVILLFVAVYVATKNLLDWFDILEDEAKQAG